jgi:hypothetical protein
MEDLFSEEYEYSDDALESIGKSLVEFRVWMDR